jgi:cyanophycinase
LAGLLGALAFSVAAIADTRDYRDPNYDYFVAGDPALPRAGHTQFMLALMGGGGLVDAAYAALARQAGAGHIVVLRAVSDDSFDPDDGRYDRLFVSRWGPVASAETIVFHHREASFDPRVLAVLRGADGIFLAGGDQANYIRYWKGTPVQQLLNAHLRAGRPLGGSSAGLAILGRYSYTALDGGSMESKIALANPYDAGVTLEDDFLHCRWLENVITDSHFSQRSRLGRLIVFIARIDRDHVGADAYGVGIDENSALLIGADGTGRMAAGSAGGAWVVMPRHRPAVLTAGLPLSMGEVGIVRLGPQSRIDFRTRRVTAPAAVTTVSLERGIPRPDPVVSPLLMGAPSASGPTMAQMQWHRRVLIVSTPGDEDPQFIAQQLALSQWTGGDDRDLSIVRIEGDTVTGSSETASELRDRYRLDAATFSVALVGKDGHVALRSAVPVTGAQLQAEIDAMPMRKAGQR